MIQGEHRAVCAAIQTRDVAEASEAMRRHLSSSRARYRRLAEAADGEIGRDASAAPSGATK
jgi:DNA-binding FadR family transcriptional regulator